MIITYTIGKQNYKKCSYLRLEQWKNKILIKAKNHTFGFKKKRFGSNKMNRGILFSLKWQRSAVLIIIFSLVSITSFVSLARPWQFCNKGGAGGGAVPLLPLLSRDGGFQAPLLAHLRQSADLPVLLGVHHPHVHLASRGPHSAHLFQCVQAEVILQLND